MKYKLQIQGLHCEACKKITEKRLGRIEGVKSVLVDLQQQEASVNANKIISQDILKNALVDTEYKVTAITEY